MSKSIIGVMELKDMINTEKLETPMLWYMIVPIVFYP